LAAIEHVYILILEMFLWNTSRGRRVFGTTEEFARASKALAAIFGRGDAKRSILFVQGVPAAFALSAVLVDALR
jgi:putative membrane protein